MRSSEWISISDMMAGIMMIFLLITVSYMVTAEQSRTELAEQNDKLVALNDKMQAIAKSYENLQGELYQDLIKEFSTDLGQWNAIIAPDNTIRFKEPNVLFDLGEAQVKQKFKEILSNFFPRYVKILNQPKYKNAIEEVRIEGHTSTQWMSADSFNERYLGNAFLSQGRAFRVLEYCFSLEAVQPYQEWLVSVLRANGLSFSKPLSSEALSRRVEFRTIVRSSDNILKILDLSKEL